MKNLVFILLFIAISCESKKYEPKTHLTQNEEYATLLKLFPYIEKKPEQATFENRFQPQFQSYYQKRSKGAYLQKYFIDKDSNHYFLIVKNEIKSLHNDKRAVGGIFKTGANKKIKEIDLLFVTPMLSEGDAKIRGEEMFLEMTKDGNVAKFREKPDYMEWPNRNVVYDKKTNRWVFPEGSSYKVFEGLSK